jgi:hypothetical protein
MTYHILPRLRPNHTVQTINDVGTWTVRTRQVLEDISRGLHVDKVESEINSIPDMWARPMLFEMALFDREHVLHERIRGEWRGMLAMLALKEVTKLDRLTVARIKIPETTPPPEGELETEAQQRDFIRTLSKLVPGSTLAADTSWRNLYVFLFNGQPVGMTSPTTLVATAADYLNRISNQDVAWYNGTHLRDPIGLISPLQKQILSGWLNNLTTQLGTHRNINNDRWNLISGLLRDFIYELGGGTCNLSQSGFGIQGPEAGLFKYLDKPADGNVQDASHVRLIPSEGRTPAKSLLVLDRTIAEQWDMNPQDVTVDGAQTLASARVEVENAEVWRPADFFTEILFVIFQERAFPGGASKGNDSLTLPGGTTSVTPILPLNGKLLDYLTGTDLAECVRWSQVPDGLKLELFLRLSGPNPQDPNGRIITLTKTYTPDVIQTLANVPILEIWPNFRAVGWNAYFTCYSTDDSASTFAAKPYAIGATQKSEVDLGGRRQRRYWRTENHPEAMICNASVANTKTNQMEMKDAGVLLLAQPRTIQQQGYSYRVGVDFGASSTTICARTGEHSFTVDFADRKTSVTNSGDIAQAQLFDFFLPRKRSEMPVLSFFQDYKNNLKGQTLDPFLEGHAYLLETSELFDPNAKGLAFDLKWSRDKDDRRRAQAFLGQLCLQTSAELLESGASGCEWWFSYPTAFSTEQIEGFPSLWEQVTANCAKQSGVERIGDNQRRTESEATAFYFVRHRKAATAYGSIFMDIGGSTSDISVWQEDKPVWQTSVLLAGRSIFSNYLWHYPDFLSLFGSEFSGLTELKQRTGDDRKPFHAMTDALLRYKTDEIFQNLAMVAGTEQVSNLRQHLALGISGLFYYLGSLMQHLTDDGSYKKAVPNVYVGGNGSRIFRWLDIDGEGQINELYKEMFIRGAGWTGERAFEVYLSPDPKTEAAYGLVSGVSLKGVNLKPRVLAGEVFMANEKIAELSRRGRSQSSAGNGSRKLDWNTILTPEILTKKLSPAAKLERLTEFIDCFNNFAKHEGVISPADLRPLHMEEVRRRLVQSLAKYRGVADPKSIVVEPVFIMALRHLLEIRLGG